MTMQFWRSENFVIVYKENILVWNNFVKETFPKRYQLYIDKLYKILSNIINIDLSNDRGSSGLNWSWVQVVQWVRVRLKSGIVMA